jgi:large subunit ribosomal protein L13e
MLPAPKALVKVTSRRSGAARWREGRGFSIGEIEAVGLNVSQARLLGIPVDKRRGTTWPRNVEALKKWLVDMLEGGGQPPEPAHPKVALVKRKRGRAFRGLTAAGRRARGLLSVSYRRTHNYKFKRKAKERRLRKRHEATRGLGNMLRVARIVNETKEKNKD